MVISFWRVLEYVGIRQDNHPIVYLIVRLVEKSVKEDQYPAPRPPKMPSQSLYRVVNAASNVTVSFVH
jgi:hypothetical protein